jgi:hypothetical protein
MFKLMNNGGILPDFSNMLIHKKNLAITMSILINILKWHHSTCGTHQDKIYSGPDIILTCLFSDIILISQLIIQSLVLKLNLLLKKQKKLEQRLISLVLCMTKLHGIDFSMRQELQCLITSLRDSNISIAPCGLQKEQRLLQDKITHLCLNILNNA